MKQVVLLLISLMYFSSSYSSAGCNASLEAWLDCNNPIVMNYLKQLSENDQGQTLSGVNLTNGRQVLKDYIFLGKNNSVPEGVNLYTFQAESGYEAFLWVASGAKQFPLPKCEPVGLPNSPYGLSGDMYTWDCAQPGDGIIWVTCPPENWYKSSEKMHAM